MNLGNISYQFNSNPPCKEDYSDNTKELYEVFRVVENTPLFLNDHLLRLQASVRKLDLQIEITLEELSNKIFTLLKGERLGDSNIKISCLIDEPSSLKFYIYPIPSAYPNNEMRKNGINTILLFAERKNPNIKTAHTTTREKANDEITRRNAFEALLVNHNNEITEGSRTNVFFIKDKCIITAPSNFILEGIIRKKALDIIHQLGYALKLECLNHKQLETIDAAFITGTSPRILPIKSIESHKIDVNHPILRTLITELNKQITQYINLHKK